MSRKLTPSARWALVLLAATLATALGYALAEAAAPQPLAPAPCAALARAYFAYGQARGQEDVLNGATVVGAADRYVLPPITDADRRRWRAAHAAARAAWAEVPR